MKKKFDAKKQKRNQALEQRVRGIHYSIGILQYALMQLEKQRGPGFDFAELIPPQT